MPEALAEEGFCCRGCEAVYGLLHAQGLARYYELADERPPPVVADPEAGRSHTWLEATVSEAEAGAGAAASGAGSTSPGGDGAPLCTLSLDVQGIHCAACVWLFNETFRREPGGAGITVNPALGQVTLWWRRGALDLLGWVRRVEAFGYRFGPARKTAAPRSRELPLRLGVCVCLTMNVMLFSVSFYFGLSPTEPELFRLFTGLSVALTTGVVAVGGWPFFRAAAQSLRTGRLHLDLPIALGIALVYGASLAQLVASGGRGDRSYLDTLNVFVTLMLLGRFVQTRVLERNRRFLLEDDGAEGLVTRRVRGASLETVRVVSVLEGDVLLVAPGDLLPVDATLTDEQAVVSADWISGEAAPQALERGATVRAGSFNAGQRAFHAVAATDFSRSPLGALLRRPPRRAEGPSAHERLYARLARAWVWGVLALAAAGFALHLAHGLVPALDVAVALLVVTCPCAIGLATPLAYELVQAAARRAGFFARTDDLFDRLTRVQRLVFDKTGTLTLGRLELAEPRAVLRLTPVERDVAFNLAVRSRHPVSACLARALGAAGAGYDVQAGVRELPGRGVEWARADGTWRLGRSDWAAPESPPRRTVLARDGLELAAFETAEALRGDAVAQLRGLQAAGFEVWILSGDVPSRVAALAEALGVPAARALGGLAPEEKGAIVGRLDAGDTLYLGDGVNDALAFERAFVAGTPAIDRPVMPGRSDFFLVGEGLGPVAAALYQAVHLRRVVRRLIAASITYNGVVVTAGLAGLLSPLIAAVAMPLSTLTLLLMTVAGVRAKRRASGVGRP